LRIADTNEELTVSLRNGVLIVRDGIADATDAIVETTTAQLASPSEAPLEATSGSSSAYAQLIGVLDRTVTGFYMHQR
jgi:hypothetical protein